MPAWTVKVLRGDATTNGFLHSARGVGSLLAGLMIASFARAKIKGKLLALGSLLFPVLLLIWSTVRWLPLSLLVLVGVGWALMLVLNMSNILVQSHVADPLRGRVMGVHAIGVFGMLPIGSLLLGSSAQKIGEPITVALGALVALAFAGFLWLRVPQLRELE